MGSETELRIGHRYNVEYLGSVFTIEDLRRAVLTESSDDAGGLAYTFRPSTQGQQMHLQLGQLSHREFPVVVEITLLGHAILESDFPVKGGTDAKMNPALHHGNYGVRMNHLAGIDNADDAINGQGAVRCHRNVRYLGDHCQGFLE